MVKEIRQLILPISLKDKVLRSVHDSLGHQAVEKTSVPTRGRCSWPGMVTDIAEYSGKCERCTLAKAGKKLHSTMSSLTASKPLETLAIDFTVLERSCSGIENVLVLTDVFTKFTQAIPTKDQKATTVAHVLVKEWIVRFGVPKRIHNDQGRFFQSKVIQELCKIYDITRSRTASYHPKGNGQCSNRTMQDRLRTMSPERKPRWPEFLPELVFAYNCTSHSTTGYSPYFLFFGREPTLQVDHMLGSMSQVEGECTEWITEHQECLEKAFELASVRTEKKALRHQARNNLKRPIQVCQSVSECILGIMSKGATRCRMCGMQLRIKSSDELTLETLMLWYHLRHRQLRKSPERPYTEMTSCMRYNLLMTWDWETPQLSAMTEAERVSAAVMY